MASPAARRQNLLKLQRHDPWRLCRYIVERMPDWDPKLYLKFSDQRGRPAADLIGQIQLKNPQRIMDLGCGTGSSTERLHQRWPKAQISGLDSSPAMLKEARENHPGWLWVESTIESWSPAGHYDLIFSNAALHWVAQHATYFPKWMEHLSPGGVLALQMPHNIDTPAIQVMKQIAADPQWSGALSGARESTFVQPPCFYYDALRKLATRLNIWETEYLQVVDGAQAVLDWLRSTALRPYLERLPDEAHRRRFEALCLEGFEAAYPLDDQGKTLFPYRRIFIVAYR
jgi:trans-aconitate 2-methyltransferase